MELCACERRWFLPVGFRNLFQATVLFGQKLLLGPSLSQNICSFAVVYQFTQQNLPACKPVLTPQWVGKYLTVTIHLYVETMINQIIYLVLFNCFVFCSQQVISILFVVGVIFIPVGLIFLHASQSVTIFNEIN